jgi:LytS/YehU family sensor histidine kinase
MTEKNLFFIKKLVYSAMFLAMALLLPFLTGQIQSFGAALCPMHIPVLLCGFICGPVYGAAVGAIAPLMRHAIFGMPLLWSAIPMAFELAAYGLCAGLLYKLLPKKNVYIYVTLISSMLAGRIIWGAVSFALAGLRETSFSFAIFSASAFAGSVPGIILQIVLIPVIVMALKRAKLTLCE